MPLLGTVHNFLTRSSFRIRIQANHHFGVVVLVSNTFLPWIQAGHRIALLIHFQLLLVRLQAGP